MFLKILTENLHFPYQNACLSVEKGLCHKAVVDLAVKLIFPSFGDKSEQLVDLLNLRPLFFNDVTVRCLNFYHNIIILNLNK